LRIREGGVRYFFLCGFFLSLLTASQSIPSVPDLEKEFGCHALHLPLGQSTVRLFGVPLGPFADSCISIQDQAHLPNERISMVNLRRGKSVIERFLQSVSCLV
jgi:di- and tripeptidase